MLDWYYDDTLKSHILIWLKRKGFRNWDIDLCYRQDFQTPCGIE